MRLNRMAPLVIGAGFVWASCSAPAVSPKKIVVDNFEYQPASLTVSVGDTVEWDNKDGVDHSATSQTGGFDVALPAGKSGTFVAKTPGTFDYICTLHPNMKATLTVAAR